MTRPDPDDAERLDAEREQALVDRARTRDAEAFRELVDRHRDHAYALAFRVLRSAPDAEEVAQDAFVRAWVALPGFRGESRFGTWLHSIVMRRALDRVATLKGRRARETELDTAGGKQFAAAGADPGERARLALRMTRLMERLSEMQRRVVTLFYFEERPVEDIARALGIPIGTVKTHLSRARTALREAWVKEQRP